MPWFIHPGSSSEPFFVPDSCIGDLAGLDVLDLQIVLAPASPLLRAPQHPYVRDQLAKLKAELEQVQRMVKTFDGCLFDPAQTPCEVVMDQVDAKVATCVEKLARLSTGLKGWWNLTAHQFAEENP